MSAAGRGAEETPQASELAAALGDAGFVRLFAASDGDAVAATGVLTRALRATGTPFQASVVDPLDERSSTVGADYVLAVGTDAVAADAAIAGDIPASATAFDVASDLASDADGAGPDPILALAGTIAADAVVPPVVEAAEAAGAERRPGVAVPVTDRADGLAHSTLVHAPFSGDRAAATAALDELEIAATDEDSTEDRRRLASLVALAASETEGGAERAAEAVERALRPHAAGPFETAGGFADVLDAAARTAPGVALSLALGHEGAREPALAAWREHGAAAHDALSTGDAERHDGLWVLRARDTPLSTVARLGARFRSPESVVLAVGDGEAALYAADDTDAGTTLTDAAETIEGATAAGSARSARARFDGDGSDLVDAVRRTV